MASMQFFAILAIVVTIFPAFALAKEFIVGDDSGWNNKNFDYQAWAKDKEFQVGDKLVFKYTPGSHNVHKVNGTGFKDCIVPTDVEPFKTGNDVITLATAGNKWYICGKAQHCQVGGQKLFITVMPAITLEPSMAPSASPPPSKTSSASGIAGSRYQVYVAAVVAVLMVFVY